VTDYAAFLDNKQHTAKRARIPTRYRPEWLFDFQSILVDWAVDLGRAAIFADCGLGKTPMQLVWAQNIVEHTNRPVLIVTPLSVSSQTAREAAKFSIQARVDRAGGSCQKAEIVITNYEQLHRFNAADFDGVVCDESSILKNFDGTRKAQITEFLRTRPYRLLCTATAAPNDYIELGTSSEALGVLGYMDMLSVFFKNDEGSIAPLSYATKWRFKPHAETSFWRWMQTWARVVRTPTDLGCEAGTFILPPLEERITVVHHAKPLDGRLFVLPAETLQDQRAERRATINARCERAVELHRAHRRPFIAWCHLNAEGDLLDDLADGDAVQVSGSDPDEKKIEKFDAFTLGHVRGLITKPSIGGFGMNWQHCADVSLFPSHSYEQYYQAIRRCWRYGQTRAVTVDVITTEGEAHVLGNLQRKADAADAMFTKMAACVGQTATVALAQIGTDMTIPSWLTQEPIDAA
jgi:hypothetical protein